MTTFYTYLYLDPITHEHIYVGKGSGHRYKNHLQPSYKSVVADRVREIRAVGYEPIVIVLNQDNEEAALSAEEAFINFYGRKDIDEGGTLLNRSTGNGTKGCERSFEWLENMSSSLKGQTQNHKLVTCPHCGKVGRNRIMHRWHFDKCRNKP